MIECAYRFIAFTPYHFVAFTIFSFVTAAYILVCCTLTNMVTPSFFRIFSNDIDLPIKTFCENLIKIIKVHLPQIS